MKKIMLIGKTGSGKTSLTQRLSGQEMTYKKTQSLEFSNYIIDTPGEYIENKRYYNALLVSSYDSDVIAMVQDVTDKESIFPPGFASAFSKEVIGIVTKADCLGDVKKAEGFLKSAGAFKIFMISSLENQGIEELKEYLNIN